MLLLTEIEKIIPLTPEIEAAIKKKFIKRNCVKGQRLHEVGKVANELYFIEKGVVRMFYYLDTGKDVTYGFYSEGEFTTSLESFHYQTPSQYEIEILEDGIVYAITFANMEKLLKDFPVMQKLANKTLQNFLLMATERNLMLKFKAAEDKYKVFMKNEPNVIGRVPLGMIASYLGITQETVSRIRAKK